VVVSHSTLNCEMIADHPVLLSSHRDYKNDREWEVLRNDSPYAGALRFEETSDTGPTGRKRFEMVVTAEWSSLVS
jgi:hypothetical protein